MNQTSVSPDQLSPLICTKITIPRARNLLSRPRLLDSLHENVHRKLIIVCAGPGYGKTSLLLDFANDTDLPVCWYTLDPADRDPRVVLDYLVEAVRVRFPDFGQRTKALLRQGAARDLRGTIGTLVNELVEQVPEYVVVVLDDYHTVESQDEVNHALDTLIRYLPEHVHLILSSRTLPPVSLTRMAAYGETAALGTDLLRFTAEEAGAVLRQSFGLILSEEEARDVAERTEGWITGILLRAHAGRQEMMDVLVQTRAPQDHVYAYLTEEVLRHLTPEVREFLKKASIPKQMDAAFCDALLERQESAQILDFLERRNLFLVPLEGDWYRFHALFREFLLEEIGTDWDEFVRLQRRAAQLWRERGEPAEAVEHLLQARAYEEAASEINGLVREFFGRGRFQTLARWTEALPERIQRDWPRLVLFRGKAYMAMGQGEKARSDFLQAGQLFAQRNDVKGWGQALADRALLERVQGSYHDALETASAALAHAEELGPPAIVDLHRTIGVCLQAQGDLETAEAHARAAVEHSPGAGWYNQALAYLDLGFCLYTQGRLEEAGAAFRQALERCRTVGSPGLEASILNNMAMEPFLRGELQEAQDLLRQALAAAQTSLSPYFQALAQGSLGDVYRDLGDLCTARQIYQEGLEQARRSGNAALIAYLLDAQGNLARQAGSLAEARGYLKDALEAAGSSQADRARVQVSLALLEAAEGKRTKALQMLEAAAVRQEQGGWRPELLRNVLAQAIVLHQRRHKEKARKALRRATALAEEMGILEPFLAEGEALLPFLRQLPRASRKGLLQKVLGRLQTRAVVRAETAPTEGRPPLRILALGPGQVFLDDREIQTREWRYRQSREFFFYLFFHTPTRRGDVGLSFWPDRSPARVSSAFHAALYQARRAIGYPFVVFEEDIYHWNPAVPYWCDAIEFERLLDQAEELPPGDAQAIALLEQGTALYQGDFLEEFDREWCILYRETLCRRYLQALLRLGDLYLGQQDLSRAQEAYQRVLQVDSFREEAYRGLMRCHALAGERASAMQVYRQCRRHLLQELQVEPSEETESLRQVIASGELQPQRLPQAR